MDAHSASVQPSLWKGLVAGAVGGFVASWAMEQFQQRFSRATGDRADAAQHATRRPEAWDARTQDQLSGQNQSATEHAAEGAVDIVAGGGSLHPQTRASAAQALHYAFGIGVGAVYGALAESNPRVTQFGGVVFGLGVWAAADEISMSLFGLAPPPDERPPLAHTYSVLSHVVYGLTTESVRRAGRTLLD
jgi:putative membrane protein